MDAAFERVLVTCLEALERGDSIADILNRFPQYEDEIRPILETTQSLSQVRVAHSLEAQARSRQQLLAQAAALRSGGDKTALPFVLFRRLALTLVPLAVVLAFLGVSVIYASADTVPGDFLYNSKRNVENLRMALTADPFSREGLREKFQEERIWEIERLLGIGREAEVSFSGVIGEVGEDAWVIAGLQISITDATIVDGSPLAGRYAWVSGSTSNGQLTAIAITIQFVPDTVPAPEPIPQNEALPTLQLPQRATATPAATVSPTPVTTPTAEPTMNVSTPDAPEDVGPPPTDTPAEGPEDGENGNDGDDDNSNDDAHEDNENENEENENDSEDNENEGEDNENEDDENRNEDEENENDDSNSNDNDDEENENKNSNDGDGSG